MNECLGGQVGGWWKVGEMGGLPGGFVDSGGFGKGLLSYSVYTVPSKESLQRTPL